MTKYYVPLTEQEKLSIRQLATQPGFEVIYKLLQMESLDAQAEAMECKSPKMEERAMAQMQAQVAKDIVSSLTNKLDSYRQSVLPAPEAEDPDPLGFNVFDQRSN
jgi:hypothetical protein